MEDGYGRRGEREGKVDMGRRWRAWWRPGEREWWWRGLGVVDGYGRRGERGARRGLWGEGGLDVGRDWRAWRCRGERERWWRGLGLGVLYGRRGEGGVDMGRRWRSWWRLGEWSGGSGVSGGCGGTSGSGSGASGWLRRGGGVGSVGAGGKCALRGGERERCRLRDRASSLESGQSEGVGGSWGALPGAAWYWGGGGWSPVAHGYAT